MTSAMPTPPVPAPKTADEFVDMPAEEIRGYLDSGQEPPRLSDEQIRQLPPSTLEPYIVARESAGDTGILGRVKAIFRADAEAGRISEQRRQEMQSYGVEYRDGVPVSENNYRAIDHQRLKAAVEPIVAEGITVYSDGYHNLHKLLQDLSDQLKESVGKSKRGWKGDAADNAHGYFTGLSAWAEGNSHNARMASEIVHQETEAASRAKYSMPEPVPFDMNEEMKNWGSDPFAITEKISATVEKQQRSQQAHDEAARVMSQYDADLHQAGNKQPVFTEPPNFGSGGGSGENMPSNMISIPGDGDTSASGFAGAPTGMAGGGGSFSSVGGGSVPAGSGGGGGSDTSPAPLPSGPGTGATSQPGGTSPSGFQPGGRQPSVPTGRNNRGNTGFGGMGAVPVGGMGAAGGFGPGGGGDSSSKMGRGVGGFGPGGGSGAAAGPGVVSGARPGAMPGPGGAAAAGGAGAASAAARGGMGVPMGAGGGRGGQGDEDDEHQRPTYLVEADPDEVFGTDQRTAPPVIGE